MANQLDRTLLVEAIRYEQETRPANVCVASKESVDIPLSQGKIGETVEVDISVRCLADLIVPRTIAVVCRAGKCEKVSLDVLLGLDELPSLPWVRKLIGAKEFAWFNRRGAEDAAAQSQ